MTLGRFWKGSGPALANQIHNADHESNHGDSGRKEEQAKFEGRQPRLGIKRVDPSRQGQHLNHVLSQVGDHDPERW